MRVVKSRFKDAECLKVFTSAFEATYLNQYGGKQVSLKDLKYGIEWLAQDKNDKYIPQFIGGNYIESEVSGIDEMFPTIDPCLCRGYEYPCHGEVCRVSHRYEVQEDTLIMGYKSEALGYSYKKHIFEGKNGEIHSKYFIKNLNDRELPCIWALHLMFSAAEGGRIFAHTADSSNVEFMFDDRSKYGKRGTKLKLDKDYMTSGTYEKNGDAYKFYITEPLKEGICGYYRDAAHGGIRIRYDAKKLPYLGVWINDGGFKNMYSAAVEPCNIPFDSVIEAEKRGFKFSLAPGEDLTFEIIMEKI